MAANIEIRNGVASFAENVKSGIAWHGLGEKVEGAMTAIEALTKSHADFEVEGKDIFFMTKELSNLLASGESITPQQLRETLRLIEGKKANVRTDVEECLGVVGDGYGIVQNKHAFDFVDMLTTGKLGDTNIPTFETAGVLGGGERIFLSAKFPEPIRLLGKDDNIDMYVVFTTSHDGSGAVTCMITPIRVVCNNTLNLAFQHNSGKLSFRHTSGVMTRLDITNEDNAKHAYATLNLYNTYKECFEEKLNALAKVKLTDKEIEQKLVKSLLTPEVQKIYALNNGNINHDDIPTRSKNIITNVTEAMHSGIGQDNLEKGTGLWFVNGLTTYYQNYDNWKDDEKKFDAIMDGSVSKKLQNAYSLLAV